jgi:hypothetical protein
MFSRLLDRPRPLETDIAVAWLNGKLGNVVRNVNSWAVDVQLCISDPIGDARGRAVRNDLGAEDVAIEPGRSLPVGNSDDSVVQAAATHRWR